VSSQLEQRLQRLVDAGLGGLLAQGKKGLEKESLRIAPDGHIALTDHPPALGSALTHSYITTDYSEALLEFRTPPYADLDATLRCLTELHQFTYGVIAPELIWAASMPCRLGADADIPVARYGTSNPGRMKTVYRVGLGYRYGRAMQAIAGVHFNYSLPVEFWPGYQALLGDTRAAGAFQSAAYFGLIRNFQRWGWLVSYLFGASPAMCKSFAQLRGGRYADFDDQTAYGPSATSLRMSDSGYKHKNQANLNISYNSLDEYVAGLRRAISTPYPAYERIGVKVNGEYRQLNPNVLQIENEYYSFVRPKQIACSGEMPSRALQRAGVEYVEIRALDVNPFSPIGVDAGQLRFLEALLLYCLIEDSPPFDAVEQQAVAHNQSLVACCGRDPALRLLDRGTPRAVVEWAGEICAPLAALCEVLDAGQPQQPYRNALQLQLDALEHVERLPSTAILREMREDDECYFEFALRLSERHARYFREHPLPADRDNYYREAARKSIAKQSELEAADTRSFDAYLEDYFSQR
jgi:glutamate--cysteine ligase